MGNRQTLHFSSKNFNNLGATLLLMVEKSQNEVDQLQNFFQTKLKHFSKVFWALFVLKSIGKNLQVLLFHCGKNHILKAFSIGKEFRRFLFAGFQKTKGYKIKRNKIFVKKIFWTLPTIPKNSQKNFQNIILIFREKNGHSSIYFPQNHADW